MLLLVPSLAAGLAVSGAFPGWWGLCAAGLVALVAERALAAHERRRRTLMSLNVAIGRLPEIAGHDPAGSGRQLADLVDWLARRLSFSASDRRMAVTVAMTQRGGRVALDPGRRSGESDRLAAERTATRLTALVVPDRQIPDHVTALIDVAVAYDDATAMGMDPADAVAVLRRTSPSIAAPVLDALDTRHAAPAITVDFWR